MLWIVLKTRLTLFMTNKNYADIICFEDFEKLRSGLGKVVCTSGGFDPLHPGHASAIIESKQFGDTLVVIVNGDNFLTKKKGKPFMDLDTRCRIIASLRNVDYVIPFEIEGDTTVCEALKRIKPDVFTKGGDRDLTNTPELEVCRALNIEIKTHVGLSKQWASSEILSEWGEFWQHRITDVEGDVNNQ
jgi:cytidyltransferase-like protein